MMNKLRFVTTLFLNIVVLYGVSYALSYISIKYFSGLDAYWEAKRLSSIHDDVIFMMPWELQMAGVAFSMMIIWNRLNLLKIAPRCITYSFLITIFYLISSFVAYNFIIIKVNHLIYGIDAGIMGWKGMVERFTAGAIVALPLFIVISLTIKSVFRNFNSLLIVNALTYVTIFIVDKLTYNYWFPPLVNYGA